VIGESDIGIVSTLTAVLGVYAFAIIVCGLDRWFRGPWSTP
jgi:hypothetical protein